MKQDYLAAQGQQPSPTNPTINPKQIKGLWMPSEYLFAADLNYPEKILMGFVFMLDQENHCYASNKYLGELLGVSERTIVNMVVKLKKKGYIEQVSWNGLKRVIKCTGPMTVRR